MWLGFLTNVNVAALRQTGLSRDAVQNGFKNLFVLQAKARNAGDPAVGVIVLKSEITDFGLNETGRKTVRDVADYRGGGGSDGF